MRVLYVEDNLADADLTRRLLARHAPEFQLDVVDTVAAAIAQLDAAESGVYDALLLDLRLPDGDGLEVLSHVRQNALPLAVVVLTGIGTEEMAVSALKAGADDYIPKRDDYLQRLPATLTTARARFLSRRARVPDPINVLYVEHHALDIDLTRRYLARHAPHIRLTSVFSAAEAIERLANGGLAEFDILLLDYRLPAMNALDLLKELDYRRWHDLPVILVTGQGDEDVAVEALRLGATDYLVKHAGYLLQLPRTLESAYAQVRLRREQAALHASEARYRMLYEHAPVAIFAKDREGRYTSANALTQAAFGRNPVGLLDAELVTASSAAELRRHDLEVMRTRRPLLAEERLSMVDHDEELVFLARKAPLFDEQGEVSGVMGVSVEITERVRAEAERRENQARFRQMADHIDQIFWLVEVPQNRLLYLSPAFERITGYPPTAADEDPTFLLRLVYPEDRVAVYGVIEEVFHGHARDVEFRAQHQDGRIVWMSMSMFPIFDEEGSLYRMGGLARDITEQRRSSEYAQRQERLVAVGQMAAGIAHDFNNILAVIMLYTQMLQMGAQSGAQQRQLATIYEQAQHAANLVQQILDFSRRAIVEPVQMDVVPFVKELVRLWQRTLPENIRIEHRIDGDRWMVVADPSRLQQALMNIAINARDAMPNGGLLTLTVSPVEIEEGKPAPIPTMAAGRWLALELRDTGEGMSSEVMTHIFEPFFTTKPPGAGTGLGLAQVYGIVQQMGSHIHVESTLGEGTCFTIFLVISDVTPTEDATTPVSTPGGAGQLILLIEDEEALRTAMTEMLTGIGYRVVAVENGRRALEQLTTLDETVDLVVSDLIMPELGGLDFLAVWREQDPAAHNTPLLLVSGYPVEESVLAAHDPDLVHRLPKPFTLDGLAQRVHAILQHTTDER